jgi:hypothetical protein
MMKVEAMHGNAELIKVKATNSIYKVYAISNAR